MRNQPLNLRIIILYSGLLSLIFLFSFFLWKNYFFAYSPVSIEEEKIPSFLQIQAIKKSASFGQNFSQLTSLSPSATLEKASPSAEVKGENPL